MTYLLAVNYQHSIYCYSTRVISAFKSNPSETNYGFPSLRFCSSGSTSRINMSIYHRNRGTVSVMG